MTNKVLYIGAGNDTNIVNIFTGEFNCNYFILVDTLPRSSWDEYGFVEEFYRPDFINNIKQEFKNIGFELIKVKELNKIKKFDKINLPFINPHLLEFKNGNKIVKYYVSTNITTDGVNNELKKDLIGANILYIKGYFPEIKLLDYFKRGSKKIFIGDDDTIYSDTEDNSINYLQNNNNSNNYFSDYYICINNMIIKCDKTQFNL
jgi:hypothetical protein